MKADRIFRTSAISFALRMVSAGVTYAFLIALARTTETADFGIIGTIISASLLFSIIASAGQRMALLRFVPGHLEAEDHRATKSSTSASFRLALVGNGLMYLCLAAAAIGAGLIGKLDNAVVIAGGLLIVPLMGIIDMQAHLARAYRLVVLALVPKDILWRSISGTILVTLYFCWGARPVSLEAALSVLVGTLAGLIAVQGLVMRMRYHIPSAFVAAFGKDREPPGEEWRKARNPLWIASIVGGAFNNLDVIAVGLLLGPETAAIYFSANRLAMIPLLFLVSQNIALGPNFSMHYASGKLEAVRWNAVKASIYTFLPTLGTAIFIAALAGPILSLFGDDFAASRGPLFILLGASVLATAFGPSNLLLTMCGQEEAAMRISAFSTLVGGIVIFVSTVWQSAEAVAIGVLLAQGLMRGLAWWTARRTLGFAGDVFSATVAIAARLRSRASA